MNPQNLFDVITDTPLLPGAACRGHAPLFDEDHDQAAALALCGHCRARQACRTWFLELQPRQRPEGVVAGLIHHRNPKTRRSIITHVVNELDLEDTP